MVLCLLKMYIAVCKFCQQEFGEKKKTHTQKFSIGNSQGDEISKAEVAECFSIHQEHYQKKNESATLDCKEQHGVNATKRENNTNCLPVIN